MALHAAELSADVQQASSAYGTGRKTYFGLVGFFSEFGMLGLGPRLESAWVSWQ